MSNLDNKLKKISGQLDGGVTPKSVSVKELLEWYGVTRRGSNVNWSIRKALEKHDLDTVPDFTHVWVHSRVNFVKVGSVADREAHSTSHQIGSLDSANREPVSVQPGTLISEAITKMLSKDYSQLPVITTPRELKGAISWKSIGSRIALGQKCAIVNDCMDPAQEVSTDTSLWEAIELIAEHDYVLVRALDKTVCGIVTASDLSLQFRDLAEPFLLIGECEKLVRRLIHGKYNAKELEDAKHSTDDGREIGSVSDLTFGEYIWLLSNPDNWNKLNLNLDRADFISRLDQVREIRNDVMHFDPNGVLPESLDFLRESVQFLQNLRRIGAI